MNEGVLRKMDTALQNELARLGKRSRNGGSALGVRRIARRFAGMKKRSSTWLSNARLSMSSGRDPGSENGGPSGDWQTPARRGLFVAFLTFIVFGGWVASRPLMARS